MQKTLYVVQTAISAAAAWISAKLGILLPVLIVLVVMMTVDYLTGMAASKVEAIDHPDDPSYGWSSKKGLKGIFKKVGYLCVIAVAMVIDYIIMTVAAQAGIAIHTKIFFGLLVMVWYILYEALSIIENVGRMGAPVPVWLAKYIAVLKGKVEDSAKDGIEEKKNETEEK